MSQSGKGFFAIDRRVWAKVQDLGMNPMVAYLVLACGTGGDNKSTSWSTQAVAKYAGIGIERAKSAIAQLISAKFIAHASGSTRVKPRYELILPNEVNGDLEERIWLPNTIVVGTPAGTDQPPVHRIRSAGDVWALRLFVDLYHAQNLRDDGGISPNVLKQNFDRERVAEQGIYVVWAFRPGKLSGNWEGPFAAQRMRQHKKGTDHPVWHSVRLLTSMGLLVFVPHLVENSTSEAEVLHPYGCGARGHEDLENAIGEAANDAATSMADWRISDSKFADFPHWCPVKKTLPDVQMAGIARLLYRPQTSRTAAWYAHLRESAEIAVGHYRELAGKADFAHSESFEKYAGF